MRPQSEIERMLEYRRRQEAAAAAAGDVMHMDVVANIVTTLEWILEQPGGRPLQAFMERLSPAPHKRTL